jgi:hypothetical protein
MSQIGLSYRPARLGIDSWTPYNVYKFELLPLEEVSGTEPGGVSNGEEVARVEGLEPRTIISSTSHVHLHIVPISLRHIHLSKFQKWTRNFFVSLQIANPQMSGPVPQLQIRKFLKCASPQMANSKIDTFAEGPQI